jgi:hypothetical protein
MARWADFGVFRVRYDLPGTTITEVEVRSDDGANFRDPRWMTRHGILKEMERGMTYVTIRANAGKLYLGEPVRLVTFRGMQYIRSDRKATRCDNLGALPEY